MMDSKTKLIHSMTTAWAASGSLRGYVYFVSGVPMPLGRIREDRDVDAIATPRRRNAWG
jgi:hypothetical protein